MAPHDDLICFSHLRWDSGFHRPHHLLSRAARDRRVFFVEEPVLAGARPHLDIHTTTSGVIVVRPTLPPGTDNLLIPRRMRDLMHELITGHSISRYVLWFCTPMAMSFARDLEPVSVVYDHGHDLPESSDEVTGLAAYHAQLLAVSDVIVDDGPSISWDETWSSIDDQLQAVAIPDLTRSAASAGARY